MKSTIIFVTGILIGSVSFFLFFGKNFNLLSFDEYSARFCSLKVDCNEEFRSFGGAKTEKPRYVRIHQLQDLTCVTPENRENARVLCFGTQGNLIFSYGSLEPKDLSIFFEGGYGLSTFDTTRDGFVDVLMYDKRDKDGKFEGHIRDVGIDGQVDCQSKETNWEWVDC